MRCDRGDFVSTGDAAACDAASAEGCGGSASRALASASISGCGVGLRPIFATPAVKSSALAWMRWRRAAAAAPEYGWHSLGGRLLCFAQPVARGGLALWLGALGPWIGDVRRSDSRAHTAQQQGSRSSSDTGAGGVRRRNAQERRILQALLWCRECWNPTMEMARGRPVGVGETNDGLQLVAPSIGLASRSQAVEKGEGRTCIDYCKCERAYQCKYSRRSLSPGARSI